MTTILPITQLQPGRGNCENFALVATSHADDELAPICATDTFELWTCATCGYTEKLYLPLNSDIEREPS